MFCCGCGAGRGSRGARRDQWHGCLSSTRRRTPSRITFLTLLFWNNRFRVKVARGSVSCAHTRISWLPAKLRIIQEASFFGSLQCASVRLITDHQTPIDYVLDQARLAVYRCHVLFVPKGRRKGAEVVVGAHSALHAGRDFGTLSGTVCIRARTLLLHKTPVAPDTGNATTAVEKQHAVYRRDTRRKASTRNEVVFSLGTQHWQWKKRFAVYRRDTR